MSAGNHRRATADVVGAIVAIVAGLVVVDKPEEKVFERVELFDSENLVEAFRYLLVTEQRVAVVVPLDEEFESVINGLKLVMKRRLPVAVLVSDRVLGDRKAAIWGNDDTPGAMGLAEKVLPAVTGLLLPNPMGVVAEPRRVSILSIQEKELPMRVTVAVEFECRGGWMEAELAKGQVL